MLVTKAAPTFKTMAVMPDNSFEEISLSDFTGKKYLHVSTRPYTSDANIILSSEIPIYRP